MPAAVKNADPLEGQRTYRGLVGAALVALLPIVETSPEGFVNGLAGPFHKGLPDKRRALPAPVHPTLLATAFRDGCNAGVLLEFIGAHEALALFAEGREQSWRQVWTGSR